MPRCAGSSPPSSGGPVFSTPRSHPSLPPDTPAFLKSCLAVLAGFLLTFVMALGTDAILHAVWPARFLADGNTEDAVVLALTLAYLLGYVVVGCSFAAFLAPAAPLRHALILGVLELALTLIPTVMFWESTPAWYHFGLLLALLPAAWVGGVLGTRSRPDSAYGTDLED